MKCSLHNYKKEVITHWVGVDGSEYPVSEYSNWGDGKIKEGKRDLPISGYPYRFKKKTEQRFDCCNICNC